MLERANLLSRSFELKLAVDQIKLHVQADKRQMRRSKLTLMKVMVRLELMGKLKNRKKLAKAFRIWNDI
jgi:hypothetical protein